VSFLGDPDCAIPLGVSKKSAQFLSFAGDSSGLRLRLQFGCYARSIDLPMRGPPHQRQRTGETHDEVSLVKPKYITLPGGFYSRICINGFAPAERAVALLTVWRNKSFPVPQTVEERIRICRQS
jgi:hypothetical protein